MGADYIKLTYPKVAGWYEVCQGFKISATKKPSVLHRLFTRWLLGWKWEDAHDA